MSQGDLYINSLSGGYNDTDPVTSLGRDMATLAENVEFHCSSREEHSTLGTRRSGTSAITTSGITAGADILLLHNHTPGAQSDSRLWVIANNAGTAQIVYKDSSWHTVTTTDAISVSGTDGYYIQAQSLHNKLFLFYNSSVDRLHVIESGATNIRRTGIAEPAAAPTGADTGSGSFSGTRYYRVRFVEVSGATTLRRSEPSEVLTFSPSGSGTGVVVTRPTAVSEGETHWELEASLDNSNFYIIATTAIGTTTATDSTVFSTGYAVSFELSEDIGDYALLHSAKYGVADDDRLVIGGSWEDANLGSRVAWTPVKNDPGVGNDERSPIDTDNFIDLDTHEGGELTGLSKTVNGYIFAFKWKAIYQLTRTGQRARAYTSHALTKERGAIPGSIVAGLDQNGRPCLYFLDPEVGPCRVGDGGIQTCGKDIHKTWETVNKDATVVARAVYYSDSHQVHWWVATDSSNFPDTLLVLHSDKSVQAADGIRKGWVKFTGVRATAIAACMFADNIQSNTTRSTKLRPFIGLQDGTIHMCDTGDDDSGTAFTAKIRSGPIVTSLLRPMGIMDGAIVAKAAEDVILLIKIIRDFGVETLSYRTDLTPEGSEDPVIRYLDEFVIAESMAIQIEFSDDDTPSGDWNLFMFAAGPRSEGD